MNKLDHKEWSLVLLFVIAKLLIHFLTNTNYELHRDAYLYLALSDHLDFGFISVPPLIGVIGKIVTVLFGDSVFAVRLAPALTGGASIIIIALIVKEFGGKHLAIIVACLAFLLSPAFLRTNTYFMPVPFNHFFWTLIIYLVIKMVNRNNPKLWMGLGLVFGLGFLNKYSIVFLDAALVIGLILTPHRKLLYSKYIIYGVLIALAIILPNLVWQHIHGWPVVSHMNELQETQLVNVNISGFLGMQLIFNLHAFWLWILAVIILLVSKKDRKFRFIGWCYIALLALLLAASGKHYYTLGIYPALFAAGGYVFERLAVNRLKWLVYPAILYMVSIGVFIAPFSLPILNHEQMIKYGQIVTPIVGTGPLTWEDGNVYPLPQDYADMTGWEELSNIVVGAYESLSATERERCAIYASNYGEAGAIRYFGKAKGIPDPFSFNGSFALWAPDSLEIDYLIYVDWDTSNISQYFESVKLVGRLSDPYARESGLPVFICSNPHAHFFPYFSNLVKDVKSEYLRKAN